MRLAFIVLIILAIPVLAYAATLKVPSQYPTIQAAINASMNGDTVIVEPGTYLENIDFIGRNIVLKSEMGPYVTIIDGNQVLRVVRFANGETAAAVLDGFTITNGILKLGGGIRCLHSSPTIINNIITGNTADDGGGIFCSGGSPTIADNIISGNSATNRGGGIGNVGTGSSPIIMNNTIEGNTADGGGGVNFGSFTSPTITNTVLWNNIAITGMEIWVGTVKNPATLTISYSDVKDGKSSCFVELGSTLNWGSGMIDADPLFVDSDNNDFHLTYSSPCKDTGDNTAVTELYDFEGDPRIAYGTVDMGADEFYTHLYWTGDATPGGNVELKFVGLPGTSPVQLWLGSGVIDPPMTTKYGDWYLQFPLLASVGLGSIPSPEGVLVFPFTFPANMPTPLSLPFQAGVGMELSNLSVMEVE